jgi:hypothetical protein
VRERSARGAPGGLITGEAELRRRGVHGLAAEAASTDRRNGTKRGVGTAPESRRSREEVYGEGARKRAVGRFQGRTPTGHPPGVRRKIVSRSTVG